MADSDPLPPSSLRLREFLPYRLSVLSNTVSRRIAKLYDREFGLTIWQWRVMAVLGDSPGLSATDISQRTAMDKVAVSRAISGMIETGLIERKTSQSDGRRSELYLTVRGQSIYNEIVPLALSEEQVLVSALSEEDQAELARLLDKLARSASPERDIW